MMNSTEGLAGAFGNRTAPTLPKVSARGIMNGLNCLVFICMKREGVGGNTINVRNDIDRQKFNGYPPVWSRLMISNIHDCDHFSHHRMVHVNESKTEPSLSSDACFASNRLCSFDSYHGL